MLLWKLIYDNYYYYDIPCLVFDVLGIGVGIGKNYIAVLTSCFLPFGLYNLL